MNGRPSRSPFEARRAAGGRNRVGTDVGVFNANTVFAAQIFELTLRLDERSKRFELQPVEGLRPVEERLDGEVTVEEVLPREPVAESEEDDNNNIF